MDAPVRQDGDLLQPIIGLQQVTGIRERVADMIDADAKELQRFIGLDVRSCA